MYMWANLHIHRYMYVFLCVYKIDRCVRVCVRAHACVHVYMCVCVCARACIHIHRCVCGCVCSIYIYCQVTESTFCVVVSGQKLS